MSFLHLVLFLYDIVENPTDDYSKLEKDFIFPLKKVRCSFTSVLLRYPHFTLWSSEVLLRIKK